MKAVISNRIYMSLKDRSMFEDLRKSLSYVLPPSSPRGKPIRLCELTRINSNLVSVPIGRTDLIPSGYKIIDKRVSPKFEFPEFKASLRGSQQIAYDITNDNIVINAKPGWGKTFTALAIASKLGLKTLIVVHTLALREQWEEEIEKVFGIKPGIVGSGKLELNKDIVVGNVQTLTKHADKISSMFGTLITDECHRVPASTFKKILDRSKARYKIGLSGTLNRKDGRHILIPDYISKTVYSPEEENVMEPEILVLRTDFKIPGNPMMPWANRITMLSKSKNYRDFIVKIASTQIDKGHKILLVSDRLEFLEYCHKSLEDNVYSTHLIIGNSTKKDERPRKELIQEVKDGEVDGICGTVSIFKEGISINNLSCLIMASPINNQALLEQLIGRVTRQHPGKKIPIVIDIAMKGKTGANHLKTREAFYYSKSWKVKYL